MPTSAPRNADLFLEKQKYGADPTRDRDSDHYRNEYITGFVDKWDALIDWDARATGEGDFFLEVLRSRGKHTVLDAATGTGFHSVRLIEAGFDVTSLDGSAPMLARAFENARDRGIILKTLQSDWRWLGFATRARFDAITCLGNSFTHLHDELDRRRVLAEFYAALEPNGVLIIDQRNYDTMLDVGFRSKHKYYYCGDQVTAEPIHIDDSLVRFQYSFPDGSDYTLNLSPIRRDHMRRLLREAGFERVRTYGDFDLAHDAETSDFFVHVAEKSAHTPRRRVEPTTSSRAVAVAEDYYDSDDADAFYSRIWGGQDLHLGIYFDGVTDIAEASVATVDHMLAALADAGAAPGPGSRIIDLGAGYGGSARRIAATTGASVTCLNLSDTQNDRNRVLTRAAGLADLVSIVHGDFADIPKGNDSFDVVWSQDAFLHAPQRDHVIAEAFRVLKPGGHLIFTDPMEVPGAPAEVMAPIYDRLALPDLGSVEAYSAYARLVGFESTAWIDLSDHLPRHFQRVAEDLTARRAEVEEAASPAYVSRMLEGLDHWVSGGRAGQLAWGIQLFRKP